MKSRGADRPEDGRDEQRETPAKGRRWGKGWGRTDSSPAGQASNEEMGWLADLRTAKEQRVDIGPGADADAAAPPGRPSSGRLRAADEPAGRRVADGPEPAGRRAPVPPPPASPMPAGESGDRGPSTRGFRFGRRRSPDADQPLGQGPASAPVGKGPSPARGEPPAAASRHAAPAGPETARHRGPDEPRTGRHSVPPQTGSRHAQPSVGADRPPVASPADRPTTGVPWRKPPEGAGGPDGRHSEGGRRAARGSQGDGPETGPRGAGTRSAHARDETSPAEPGPLPGAAAAGRVGRRRRGEASTSPARPAADHLGQAPSPTIPGVPPGDRGAPPATPPARGHGSGANPVVSPTPNPAPSTARRAARAADADTEPRGLQEPGSRAARANVDSGTTWTSGTGSGTTWAAGAESRGSRTRGTEPPGGRTSARGTPGVAKQSARDGAAPAAGAAAGAATGAARVIKPPTGSPAAPKVPANPGSPVGLGSPAAVVRPSATAESPPPAAPAAGSRRAAGENAMAGDASGVDEPTPPDEVGALQARSENRRRMREQRQVRIVALIVVSLLVLGALPLYFSFQSAQHDPVFTALDNLAVPEWAALSTVDQVSGSRWCVLECRFRQREVTSGRGPDETARVYEKALHENGWRRWKAKYCPDPAQPIPGHYTCWRRDELTLDLWVRKPKCATKPAQPTAAPTGEASKQPSPPGQPGGSEDCPQSLVLVKVQNAIDDERTGPMPSTDPSLTGEDPDPIFTDDPLDELTASPDDPAATPS